MKQSFKKTTSIVLTLVMVLSLVSAIPFATVSAYVAGGISGTTGRGQTESDPVVVNTFAELDAALRHAEIKYIKAISPNTLSAISVSSTASNRNVMTLNNTDKHLTVEGTWDFTNNGTCDHLISVSGATLELAGSGTIRYSHNKMGGSGAVIKVHSSGTLKVVSDSITLEGYGASDLYDAWGDPVYEKENQSRAIYVDGGKLEINGGTYKGSCYAFYPGDDYYVESVYITNNATATINGGAYSTQKYDSGMIYNGGLRIINSPNAFIKGGMFDGIRVESADGTDSIYNHLYRGTRMINLTKNNVFNTRTKQVLDDVEAINFIPYQFSTFILNGNASSGNGSFTAKIGESVSFSFNVTPLSNDLLGKGITSQKSYAIKDTSQGTAAVAGSNEANPNKMLAGSYNFKAEGTVTINCYNNFYYNGESIFSWMKELVYSVQLATYTVSGTISGVDSSTTSTIELLKYVGPGYEPYAYKYVTGNGTYSFTNLPVGTYKIAATAEGYVPTSAQYRIESDLTHNFAMRKHAFTTQPMGGGVAKGEKLTVSWALNFTPVKLQAVVNLGTAQRPNNVFIDLDPAKNTAELSARTNAYVLIAFHGTRDSDFVRSKVFYVTEVEPAFTTQPVGGEVAKGGKLTVNWETNYTPKKLQVLKYSQGYCIGSQNLDVNATTANVSAGGDYYIIRAYYSDTEYVDSDKFYVTEGALTQKGDVNGDGYGDNLDAAMILKYDAGILDSINEATADVNGDGYTDNLDAAMILKYDAGIIDEL